MVSRRVIRRNKIIITVLAVITVLGIGGLLIYGNNKKSNRSLSNIITLDINPSIEMEIKDGFVIRVKAINEDANDIIKDTEDKFLDEALNIIIKNTKEQNIVKDDNITIILGMDNNDKKIENALKKACSDNELNSNIIVPVITEEAKSEAQARGITAAKAAYILDVVKENNNLHIEDMINKSSDELSTIKETGKYCDNGYTLVGDFCERVLREEKPIEGKTCPDDYEDIKGKCYKTSATKKEAYCKDGLTLKNGKCVGTLKTDAIGKCDNGTYNSKTKKCEVLTLVGDASMSCKEADDLLLSNGKCASHKPGAHSYGDNDEPFNEATECCCGGTFHTSPNPNNPGMGWCYNMGGDYTAKTSCPSGQTLKDNKCYTATTSEATFTCSNGTLEGNMCVGEVSKEPSYKLACDNGLTLYKDRVCIDYNNSTDYIIGYTCEKEARLINNTCKYYEQIEAKEQ